jgi:hypothetical protein
MFCEGDPAMKKVLIEKPLSVEVSNLREHFYIVETIAYVH